MIALAAKDGRSASSSDLHLRWIAASSFKERIVTLSPFPDALRELPPRQPMPGALALHGGRHIPRTDDWKNAHPDTQQRGLCSRESSED
jgi:hypothetical protein